MTHTVDKERHDSCRGMLDELVARKSDLDEWEGKFVERLSEWTGTFSLRQASTIEALYERLLRR